MAALEALVQAGKVRYLGVSDTPAWKIVEANVIARFCGWSAFIGLQIEYSLLERTVEQELVPMALEAWGSRRGHRSKAGRSAASTPERTPVK